MAATNYNNGSNLFQLCSLSVRGCLPIGLCMFACLSSLWLKCTCTAQGERLSDFLTKQAPAILLRAGNGCKTRVCADRIIHNVSISKWISCMIVDPDLWCVMSWPTVHLQPLCVWLVCKCILYALITITHHLTWVLLHFINLQSSDNHQYSVVWHK